MTRPMVVGAFKTHNGQPSEGNPAGHTSFQGRSSLQQAMHMDFSGRRIKEEVDE
ncbi:MAG: hypothetical protein KF752_17265 [Pirellulaceae bacterium]|nr:hypothetical protein [Pirellulaceae bacterium]